MPKLKLRLDALRVESFETEVAARARGTVEGHSFVDGAEAVAVPATNDVKMCLDSWINTCVTARISDCPGETCGNQATCLATCDTCGATCITICGFTCPTGSNDVCCA
jgi:hypothetical protein